MDSLRANEHPTGGPAAGTSERIEIACAGGRGRTGTALACVAVLDGVPATKAVAYVRGRYDRRAVETVWQRWYVRRFGRVAAASSRSFTRR